MFELTHEERNRFAEWLEKDAVSTEGLIEQMMKIPRMETIIKIKRIEVSAQRIVAKMLRSVEDG